MEEDKEMSFWDHLEELRWSLMRVIIALGIFLIGWFSIMPAIFKDFVLGPTNSNFFLYKFLANLSNLGGILPDFGSDKFSVEIININVASQFMTHISTSLWFAFVSTFPYLIYELWKFIRPALYPNEKKYIGFAFLFGTFMFYLGCAVGYSVVFPFTFRFLTEYQLSDTIINQISLNSYMDNFMLLVMMMGIVFELPMMVWILSRMGIINRSFLKKYRKHAVVVLLVLAAFITPTGDPFTLMTVFLPLYLLYEFGIILAKK